MANFTVKDCFDKDKEAFNNFKTSKGLPANKAFSLLIQKINETPVNTQDNQALIDSLQIKIDELTAQKKELTENAHKAFRVTEEQNQQIQALQTQVDADSSKVNLEFPQFICSPNDQLATNMRKVRPFALKKGFVKKDDADNHFLDYPNQLAKYAIRYFIANEFKNVVNNA